MNATQAITSEKSAEVSHIKPDLSISREEYMKDRVVYKINLYDKLSKEQKFRYQITSLVGIILSASVPALITVGVPSVIPTVLSVMVTILIAVEKLFHFREHWRNYDMLAAYLRTEQLKYQTGAGEYAKKAQDAEKAYKLFVKRVERAIQDERNDTIGMRTGEDDSD